MDSRKLASFIVFSAASTPADIKTRTTKAPINGSLLQHHESHTQESLYESNEGFFGCRLFRYRPRYPILLGVCLEIVLGLPEINFSERNFRAATFHPRARISKGRSLHAGTPSGLTGLVSNPSHAKRSKLSGHAVAKAHGERRSRKTFRKHGAVKAEQAVVFAYT